LFDAPLEEALDHLHVLGDGRLGEWAADNGVAARQAGLEDIEARVHQGTLRDAVLFSVGVNATPGLQRTNEDKR
jgi:hypothetical protein